MAHIPLMVSIAVVVVVAITKSARRKTLRAASFSLFFALSQSKAERMKKQSYVLNMCKRYSKYGVEGLSDHFP